MRIIVAIVLALLLGGAAVFVYDNHRQSLLPDAVIPLAKNASLRVANDLAFEVEDTRITYGELFSKIEKDIAEIDSKIIDVQTLESEENRPKVEPVLEYLKAAQEVLRAQMNVHRKELGVSSASRMSDEAIRELATADSVFAVEMANRSMKRAEEQSTEASSEFATALTTYRSSLQKLVATREAASKSLPPDALISKDLATKVLAKLPPS